MNVGESATNVGTNPEVKEVQITITPADKTDAYKPIKLKLNIHACYELGM